MSDITTHYNDNPTNFCLTHHRLRRLISELYKLEGDWDNLPSQTKKDIWRAINAKVFRRILDEKSQ